MAGEVGATLEKSFEITRDVCTNRGDSWILSSPQLIFMMERTARELVAEYLSEGQDTVGVRIDFEHKAPTLEGMRVFIGARVVAADGKLWSLKVVAHDNTEDVAIMTHRRAAISLDRYQQRLEHKRDEWRAEA